jgi:paired amphipathic helix protein Sin3a
MRGLRVEDALLYLDDVKREFRGRPHVYNEFLGIMKNFKSQEVDTPGVIARVSKLFRGYNKLILGFNTFLPEGYKISLADLERQEAELRKLEAMPQAQFRQGPPPANSENGPSPASPGPPPQHPTSQQHPQPAWSQSSESAPAPPKAKGNGPTHPKKKKGPRSLPTKKAAAAAALPPPPPPPENQNQTVEFDHAISYVTTIKKRFVHDPSTYHQFLEILHTYQKEQRGIKEVLEQVAHLFQDHPDLLKEFTFFLPDAVQEQAKERLHRAAAESETRLAAQRQQQLEQYHVDTNVKSPANAVNRQPKFIDMTHASQAAALAPGPEPQRKHPLEGAPPASAMADQSESYVYNAAVERQFFDAAREAMSFSRDGGQAWAEFLKCLDMYAQEILTRTEMLTFVEQILGKRNAKLLEEFKRILVSAGSPDGPAPLLEDSWYSVPLSEIDFSRCRRCTPSYRALPRDYPAPPCGDRSDEEAKVLNDIWVSLPVGSEESYTFRHMRRNTYEETLFRVEDERFEIDMVIDSNAATLKRLEPIAEEVAMLAQEELMPPDTGKAISDGTGLSGRRFQFTFDKSILGVIHRNSIKRIYGDSGREMLDLLVKNPTVAIPVVIERLRQKDREWRTVRKRMNRHWKELAENNYYKSLDHRGLTWRTIDKRATSTRTLISEIKDRASNKGREGKEALRQRLDKAKEEHGSFYEVTKGQYLSEDLDLTFLPKPDRRIFTPHLGHVYENNAWVQRDVYRILAFALERGPITPADKERCHRLWLEFFGPFFGLSLSWMQQPAVAFQEANSTIVQIASPAVPTVVSEEDDEDSMEDDTEIAGRVITEELADSMKDGTVKNCVDYHPLPSGAHVSTLYGEGTILQFRRSENMYVVKLNFGGTGYIRPTTVLCSVLPVEKSAYTRELRINDRTKLARAGDQLVFGTQSLYLFFRLHHILVQRLNTAKKLAYSVGEDRSLITVVEQMNDPNPKTTGRRRYEAYMSLVYALLDGGVGGAAEGGKYEDRVRGLLGHGSYELATMDKLISHIWKNLQTLSQDETMWNLVQLFRRHMDAGTFQPEAFRQEAAYLSDGEQMYAFQYCPGQGKDDAVLYAEYLGVIDDGNEGGAAMVEDAVLESVEPANKRQRR